MAIALFTLSVTSFGTEPVIFFSYDEDNFSATGNWIPADPKDQPAFPSETQIDCFRSDMTCVQATAEFYYGHPHIALNYQQIVKWEKNRIIATGSDGICMTNTMLISFAEQSISLTGAMKKLDDKTNHACNSFGAKKTQAWIFILRASERWNKEHYGRMTNIGPGTPGPPPGGRSPKT